MAWDSSRPVPWRRLLREWAIYAGLMAIVFVLFFRDSSIVGILLGLFASGPLYLVFGYVMAKFGYQRQSLRQARATAHERRQAPATRSAAPGPRPRPAPTRRTSGGVSRASGKRRR